MMETRVPAMGSACAGCEEFDHEGEDFLALIAVEAEGELGGEETVVDAHVVAAAVDACGEVAAALSEFGEGAGEGDRGLSGGGGDGGFEEFEDWRREDVHAEEAEVVAESEAGDVEFLFCLSGRGFFEDAADFVEPGAVLDAGAADGAVVGEFAFVGFLDGGDRAGFAAGDIDELAGAADGGAANVEVVADHEEERFTGGEFFGAEDGVAVAEWVVLGDELEAAGVGAGGGAVGGFVVRVDDDADFFHTGHDGFLDNDLEGGFFCAVPVDERLEGERALRLAGGGDDGFTDIHEGEQRSEVERLGGTV